MRCFQKNKDLSPQTRYAKIWIINQKPRKYLSQTRILFLLNDNHVRQCEKEVDIFWTPSRFVSLSQEMMSFVWCSRGAGFSTLMITVVSELIKAKNSNDIQKLLSRVERILAAYKQIADGKSDGLCSEGVFQELCVWPPAVQTKSEESRVDHVLVWLLGRCIQWHSKIIIDLFYWQLDNLVPQSVVKKMMTGFWFKLLTMID